MITTNNFCFPTQLNFESPHRVLIPLARYVCPYNIGLTLINKGEPKIIWYRGSEYKLSGYLPPESHSLRIVQPQFWKDYRPGVSGVRKMLVPTTPGTYEALMGPVDTTNPAGFYHDFKTLVYSPIYTNSSGHSLGVVVWLKANAAVDVAESSALAGESKSAFLAELPNPYHHLQTQTVVDIVKNLDFEDTASLAKFIAILRASSINESSPDLKLAKERKISDLLRARLRGASDAQKALIYSGLAGLGDHGADFQSVLPIERCAILHQSFWCEPVVLQAIEAGQTEPHYGPTDSDLNSTVRSSAWSAQVLSLIPQIKCHETQVRLLGYFHLASPVQDRESYAQIITEFESFWKLSSEPTSYKFASEASELDYVLSLAYPNEAKKILVPDWRSPFDENKLSQFFEALSKWKWVLEQRGDAKKP